MQQLSRRDALKYGAGLLVAGAATGCDDPSSSQQQGDMKTEPGESVHDLYDSGEVPIASSGWTRTQGVGPDYPALNADRM